MSFTISSKQTLESATGLAGKYLQNASRSRSVSSCAHYDAVVIGSGPAGNAYAREARRLGKSVAVIEPFDGLGGASLHSGTIPSKTIWQAAKELGRWKQEGFDYGYFRNRISRVIGNMKLRTAMEFEQEKITYIAGMAKFNNSKEVSVHDEEGAETKIVSADRFFIATGSRPRTPGDIVFDGIQVFHSTNLLQMREIPSRMIVVGAGVIGTEYASMFSSLGVQVKLIDKNDRPLNFIDKEVSGKLTQILEQSNVIYLPKTEPQLIQRTSNGVKMKLYQELLASPDNSSKIKARVCSVETIEADVVLFAQGRVPNTESVRAKEIGIETTPRGHIKVNSLFQTNIPEIYAGGDVIGPPSLASTSWRQGSIAARYSWGNETESFPKTFPTGIFTIPEIGYVGRTEEELICDGQPYVVGKADYSTTARNDISEENSPGFFKVLVDPVSKRLLGAHVIGKNACGMIHLPQVMMDSHLDYSYLFHKISNYPTRSGEGFRNAALDVEKNIK